jgi:ATP-dependent Lhr-like helicase
VPIDQKYALDGLHAPVRAWFEASFASPTRAQALGWPGILNGDSTLLLAPTGSGKTLAAFLTSIDRLMFTTPPPPAERLRVVYISPLKALGVDVERNLRSPLAGIAAHAERAGTPFHLPTVGIRSGDTPPKERAQLSRHPPDILITTPESLYLVLGSRARETLRSVETVVVDEIHSLVASKRGAHLFLSLERLEALRPPGAKPLQRIGLSATQRPLDEVARLLGGGTANEEAPAAHWNPRPVAVVDAGNKKQIQLKVEVPVDDMSRLGELEEPGPPATGGAHRAQHPTEEPGPPATGGAHRAQHPTEEPGPPATGGAHRAQHPTQAPPPGGAAARPKRRSIWPSIHPRLLELVRENRSTMIFANSRRLAERLAGALNELAGSEVAFAHHGSVAKEKRQEMEDRLKRGTLPCIVATSSLELGIDMGAVDLVIQIEAPPSIASGLQRLGRARHQVGGVPQGVIFPKHRGDLLSAAAASLGMTDGLVEATFYPRNPLDVLAQQIVAIAASHDEGPLRVEDLYRLVRGAAPFAELPRSSFEGVLDMLSGRYPSDEFAQLKARVTWDRVAGTLRAREGAGKVALVNAGTIPDRGLYGVFLAGGEEKTSRRVGELDEEMVFETRTGDVFVLGASSWRVEEITHDRVLVTPAPGEPGKMPFWHGDRPGRPLEFGERVGKLSRELSRASPAQAAERLRAECGLDARAVSNLLTYLRDQRVATSEVPSDDTLIVERYVDEAGDFRVCILSPFGARVHAPWATAVTARLKESMGVEVESLWSDDGIVFRLPESDSPPEPELFFPAPDQVEDQVVSSLGGTSLFAARFRENAARALLLPRRFPGKRSALWAQRKRAADLLSVAQRYGSFPILLETYRECLRDVFDLPGLVELLRRVQDRRLRVVTVDSRVASPFAATLLFAYVANFIYDGDAPLAERRAQALSIDQTQLRELLGEAELRELLDEEAIVAHQRAAQRLDRKYPPRHADALHDLLLALGDLSEREIQERCAEQAEVGQWLRELIDARRAARVQVAGEARFVAVEDIARYRDALGILPPPGVPQELLAKAGDALGDLVSRYARTHGPFRAEIAAARFGLELLPVRAALLRLAERERVLEGEFLPRGLAGPRGAVGREWCDAEVLRALKRRSLARLRKEVEPVEPAALARFSLEWQNATRPRRGIEALLSAAEQLQGAPIPASVLEREVLPARVQPFRPADLDLLFSSGELIWRGIEPLGGRDGRIALYLAGHYRLLAPPTVPAQGALAARVRDHLAARGASFFADLAAANPAFANDLLDALWDLVWAGEVTNDTLAPLRSYLRGPPQEGRRARREEGLRGGFRSRRLAPPGSEGRWSLLPAAAGTPTERSAALSQVLLARYGVLTREAVHAEGIAGGFSAVYGVLKAMEEAGRARRGYFVAGLGATQFALPGAEERLRGMREPAGRSEPETAVLAATDPANAYGATLPWPERLFDEGARPQRSAGAQVVLHEGRLLAALLRGEHQLVTFLPPEEPERSRSARALAFALADLVDGGRRRALLVSRVDGDDVARSPLAAFLIAAGFTPGIRGFLKRAPLELALRAPVGLRPQG